MVALVAVHQQQVDQVAELGHGKVGGHHGLHALLAADAHPDVGRLDHGHVIGTVADSQGHLHRVGGSTDRSEGASTST